MNKKSKVGFVGLGDMGGAQARMIVGAGYEVYLSDRREEALQPFKNTPAIPVQSLKELGSKSDVVGVCVFSDDDVKDVVIHGGEGILYGMKSGGIIAIHSTVVPATCFELEKLAAPRGVRVLDAPVSGGSKAALAKSLTVMVGGDKQAFEQAKPIFLTYGSTVRHLGPLGSGLRIKALNNALMYANVKLAASAFEIADNMGMEPEAVREILMNSSGASFAMGTVDKMLQNPNTASHVAKTAAKDMGVFRDICQHAGIGPGIIDDVVKQTLEMLQRVSGDSTK